MTLYELMKLRDEDYIETTDDVFDCIVGSNFIENEVLTDFDDFYYNNFCYYISNCIEVLDANNDYPICDWSGFINKHFNELYDFAKNNWKGIPLEKMILFMNGFLNYIYIKQVTLVKIFIKNS